jgi:hypothetical protein
MSTLSSDTHFILVNPNNLPGESKLLKSSIGPEKNDASTIQFKIPFPTKSSVTYIIQTIRPRKYPVKIC